jgi:hypothetical protein
MGCDDDGFSELANLKKRLESLGVKIKSGLADDTSSVDVSSSCENRQLRMLQATKQVDAQLVADRCRCLEKSIKKM